MDKLLSEIEEINAWCVKNGVILYNTLDIDGGSLPVAEFDSSEANYVRFLEIISRLDCKVLFMEREVNRLAYNKEDISSLLANLRENEISEFGQAWNELEPHKGEVSCYLLTCIVDRVIYKYECVAPWKESLDRVRELIELDFDDMDSRNSRISDAEIREFGKKFSEHPDLLKATNQSQRMYLANEMFEDRNLDSWELEKIAEIGHAIFKLRVEPLREREIKAKINSLLEKGLNKSKIAQKMGMKISEVNKYI